MNKGVPEGKHYSRAVACASSVGVVNGYSGSKAGTFGLNDKVNPQGEAIRAETASMICRLYLELK